MKKAAGIILSITCIYAAHGQCTFEKYYNLYPSAAATSFTKSISTTEGGFVTVLGSAYDSLNPGVNNGQDVDMCINKSDACGKLLWKAHFGHPNEGDNAVDVVETSYGDYLVTGYAAFQQAYGNIRVAKFNKVGQFIWSKLYSGNVTSYPSSIIKRKNKDRYVVSGTAGDYGYVFEIDSSGDAVRTVYFPFKGYIQKLFEVNDSSYLMLMTTKDSLYLLQTDTLFNIRWKRNLFMFPDIMTYKGCIDACLSSDGKSIVLLENVKMTNPVSFDLILEQINLEGVISRYKKFNATNRLSNGIRAISNNGYLVYGYFLLYMDSNFSTKKYIETNERFFSIVENTDKSITASGIGARNSLYEELYIVRTDNLGSIFHASTDEIKHNKVEFNIYPNPATDALHVNFKSDEKFQIYLYDVTGKLVIEKALLTKTTTINLEEVKQGLYFLRILDSNTGLAHYQKLSLVK